MINNAMKAKDDRPLAGMPKSDVLWLVQYNLMGLTKPIKMIRQKDWNNDYFYSDVSGDVCHDFESDEMDSYSLVRNFFDDKQDAKDFYDSLNRYREFIKNHI